MDERLPISASDAASGLRETLGALWGALPRPVQQHLTKAVQCYRSEVNDDEAKLNFGKALERYFSLLLTYPLIDYMRHRQVAVMDLPYPGAQGFKQKTVGQLLRLQPSFWGNVLVSYADSRLGGHESGQFGQYLETVLGVRNFERLHETWHGTEGGVAVSRRGKSLSRPLDQGGSPLF